MAFDSCLDTNLGGHCMSKENLAQMVEAKYGGLTNNGGLGSRIIATLPPKPNTSYESKWRLYVYCAPCTQTLDLAFGIAGHIVGFNAIIRIDDRLQPQCCDSGGIPDKIATFSTLYSEIEREWRNDHKYGRSWLSGNVDQSWMQQRIRRMKEDDQPSDISMDTYFAQAHVDRTCAAVIVLAPAKCCSTLLEPWPNENGKKPQVNTGDIFKLQYQGQDYELPWISSFFGTID